MPRLLRLLSAALLAASVGSCSWFQPAPPVVQVRYKSLPYPHMTVAQTKAFIACRIAYGGNDRRRKALGQEKVALATKTCQDSFQTLDSWWHVFVKLSDAYDKLDEGR